MNTYAIRITYEHLLNVDYQRCVDMLLKDVKRYYIVNETSSQNVGHLQAWVDLGDMKVATFRRHLREFTRSHSEAGDSGNKYFSCKQCDEELPPSLLSYFMKEDRKPITNLLEEDLKEAVKQQEKYKQDIKDKIANKKPVLEKIDDIIQSRMVDGRCYIDEQGCKRVWTEFTIYDVVMEYIMSSKSLVREFFVVSLCQTLCLRYVGSYNGRFKSRILDKIL